MPLADLCTPMPGMPGPNGAPGRKSHASWIVDFPAVGWPQGQRGHKTRLGGWVRFEGRAPDVTSLSLHADGFPPAVLDLIRAKRVPDLGNFSECQVPSSTGMAVV
jgi:hypothetical protein